MNYDALLVGSVLNSGSWTPQQLGSMTIALGSLSSELQLRDWSVPAQTFGVNSLEAASAVSAAGLLPPLAMVAPSQHQQQQHTKHPNQLHQQHYLVGPTAGGSTAFPASHAHAQLPFSPTKVSTSHGGMGASDAHSSHAHASHAHSFSAESSLIEMLPLGAQTERLRQLQAEVVSSSPRYCHTCIHACSHTRHACTHAHACMHAHTHMNTCKTCPW